MPKKYLLSLQTTTLIVLADSAREARQFAFESTGLRNFLDTDLSTCQRINGSKGVFAAFKTVKKGV